MVLVLIPFAHRRNPDDSIDSICTSCFQTIATSRDGEYGLRAQEASHACDPYWQFTRAGLPIIVELRG
jgi:hypothetical protein